MENEIKSSVELLQFNKKSECELTEKNIILDFKLNFIRPRISKIRK